MMIFRFLVSSRVGCKNERCTKGPERRRWSILVDGAALATPSAEEAEQTVK